ncbi:helix-turn-helix domain-containing protein [Rosenbergiella collisarenosi]|uniref:helix-turn-helix domain-containing protein n=1 Tax=Rosenbergiella collisarenosi TaxID=1544695 RepID=UPI001BDA293F|nr:helix-turn-helix domain-containing protein [Rosenbergiella collisarenosi]MBT0722080.1 helix-turn-helix domain-containing protein [Rosenbergiella collisarenosi]
MAKYSRQLKIFIANRYLSGEPSCLLSKEYSIPPRQIRYWAQVVTLHGDNAFVPLPHLRSATARFEALKLMSTNGWSLGQTSAVLNLISSGILSVWRERYNKLGFSGLEYRQRGKPAMKPSRTTPVRSDDEKSLEELKEEVAYLRAENAVLKKLEELKQLKRQQTKKKR